MTHAIDRIDPDVVVLNSFWMYNGSRPVLASDPSAQGRREEFEQRLERTVRQIARPGRHICVLNDSPLFEGRVPHVLDGLDSRHRSRLCCGCHAPSRMRSSQI